MSHPQGTLEVLLVSARGLDDTDFLSGVDPYAILTCRSQERKSSVASGEGSKPSWNETFVFNISGGVTELKIVIMDKDTFTNDDFLGEAMIPLFAVLSEGSVPPMSYNVVKGDAYCGEIKVGLKFTRQDVRDAEGDNLGGWKESSLDY